MLNDGEFGALAAAAERLRRGGPPFANELLRACRRCVMASCEAWVAASVAAKGWQDVRGAVAEEWASGPLPVARLLAVLSQRQQPHQHRHGAHRVVVPTTGLGDRLLLRGYRAQCFGDDAPTSAPADERIALVLGAGNVTSTPLLDVLQQVFVARRAVVLKCSPLHAALRPHFERALAPLLSHDLLRIECGDAQLGVALARDPRIGAVHLTGATATWLALRADPALAGKELTAEVGCVTPALLVPGGWRDGELRFVAAQLAAYAAMNGGATCLAPRVVLCARTWPQRDALLSHLREQLRALPARVPFHPAASAAFTAATGSTAPNALPPTLRAGLDLAADAALLRREHFAPVLLELPIDAHDAATFGERAAAVAREHIYGALSAYVFAPPRVLARQRPTIDRMLDALPHGTVAINTWTGLGYGLGSTPWGVPADAKVEHGAGWTRGAIGIGEVRRCVIEGPFRPRPLPPWLPAHRSGAATLRALTRYYLRPGLLRLTNVIARGMLSP